MIGTINYRDWETARFAPDNFLSAHESRTLMVPIDNHKFMSSVFTSFSAHVSTCFALLVPECYTNYINDVSKFKLTYDTDF